MLGEDDINYMYAEKYESFESSCYNLTQVIDNDFNSANVSIVSCTSTKFEINNGMDDITYYLSGNDIYREVVGNAAEVVMSNVKDITVSDIVSPQVVVDMTVYSSKINSSSELEFKSDFEVWNK
jgi:hypothetical protein